MISFDWSPLDHVTEAVTGKESASPIVTVLLAKSSICVILAASTFTIQLVVTCKSAIEPVTVN